MNSTQKQKVVSVDPIFINTPTGTVAIFGHEHVSIRMIETLGIILSHDAFETVYHGVKSVVFRTDGYPKEEGHKLCANFAPDTGGMAINMVKSLELAIQRSTDHKNTSLLASWWMEMLLNFNHELHHAVMWDTERDHLHESAEKREEEEKLAEKESTALLVELARDYDMEPPRTAEEIWFNDQIAELLDGKEDPWSLKQKQMLSDGHMWNFEEVNKESVILSSFKDFIRLLSNSGNTPEWDKVPLTTSASIQTSIGLVQSTIPIQPIQPVQEATPITNPVEDIVYTSTEDYDLINEFKETYQPREKVKPVIPQPTVAEEDINTTGEQVDMTTATRIAQSVYMKIYNFIFTTCEPKGDSDVGFDAPETVRSIPIPLTQEESSMFIGMNHQDINGRWCTDVSTTGGLLGKVMKNTKLPAYELAINLNGHTYRRLVLPQNPAKRNTAGQLTQRAIEARAKNNIMYVINKDNDTWGPSIINGEYKAPR